MKHLMNNLVKTSIGLGVVALGIFYAGKKTGILQNESQSYDKHNTKCRRK